MDTELLIEAGHFSNLWWDKFLMDYIDISYLDFVARILRDEHDISVDIFRDNGVDRHGYIMYFETEDDLLLYQMTYA